MLGSPWPGFGPLREEFDRLGTGAQIAAIVLVPFAILSCLFAGATCVFAGVTARGDIVDLIGSGEGIRQVLAAWWETVVQWSVPVAAGIALVVAGLLVKVYWPRITGWLRDRYYRGLWRVVVRPARERFGVEALDNGDAIGPSFTDVLRKGLRALDADSLWVLEGALARREPGSKESVLEYPDGMRLDPPDSGKAQEKPRFEKALDGLKNVGAIVSWEPVGKETPREFSIRVVLPAADWKTLERLRVAAEVERARRSMAEMVNRVWEELATVRREPDSAAREEGGYGECRAKVRDLSNVEALVLHYLLGEYVHYPGEILVVWVDDPQVLMSPVKDLRRDLLKSACDELVKAGFLARVDWMPATPGEEMHVHAADWLAKKSAARRVAQFVEDELRERGIWGPS